MRMRWFIGTITEEMGGMEFPNRFLYCVAEDEEIGEIEEQITRTFRDGARIDDDGCYWSDNVRWSGVSCAQELTPEEFKILDRHVTTARGLEIVIIRANEMFYPLAVLRWARAKLSKRARSRFLADAFGNLPAWVLSELLETKSCYHIQQDGSVEFRQERIGCNAKVLQRETYC